VFRTRQSTFSRCNHQHYSTTPVCIVSTLAPCAPTAAPICHLAHVEERHLLSAVHLRPASPALHCTHARTHIRKSIAHDSHPCPLLSMTRPALTAGPPSQRPSLSGLANCYAPCRRLASRSAHQSSHQTHNSDPRALRPKSNRSCAQATGPHRHFVLLDFATRRSPAGPASVIKPTQQHKLNKTLKLVVGTESWPPMHRAS
jgi:hypothetical protein